MTTTFDDIRPYKDAEIPSAMERIADSPLLPLLASYVYPDTDIEEIKSRLGAFRTIRDFQHGIMYDVNKQIIAKSISELTFGGADELDKKKPYLYVSNHRDIMLDASLLQNILVDMGHETTQITFGANLMMNPLVIDIGKSNKMFRVERPSTNMRDFYTSSIHLSQYIRSVITDSKESVWIAQRNGRTKDGNDQTDQGIIKMFCMSKPGNKIDALDELNIIPVAVSYEWESCDILKALELYQSRRTKYVKKPGEDLNSILTGILQEKGRVHFQFCPAVTRDELLQFSHCTHNEYHKCVAKLIDGKILNAYQLWPNNYIAYDMLYGERKYVDRYSDREKSSFENYLKKVEHHMDDALELKEIFLGIYANPVINKEK